MKAKVWALLICSVIIGSSCGNRKSVESTPAVAATQVSNADSKMMIIAKLSVKPDKIKDFVAVAKEMIEKSNQESGCSFYQLYQDPYDSAKFVFVEEYKNQLAVDTHFATEYFKGFGPKIGDLVAGPPEIRVITIANETLK